MKLKHFQHRQGYCFVLNFENGEMKEVDLQALIGAYVVAAAVHTARIDPEWGCLEFNSGAVDIEPKTLYQFAKNHGYKKAA